MTRKIAADEMAKFMEVICHPARLEILSELKQRECDVTTLQLKIGVSQSRMSQHLSALRKAGILRERREGRQVFYHLVWPELVEWIGSGMNMILRHNFTDGKARDALETSLPLWAQVVEH